MSEYYLADHKAAERSRQRDRDSEPRQAPKADGLKVTLLGDFMFPTTEPPGFDPYNSTQGKSPREAWVTRRDRR
jgi:hypothetical protein